MTRRRKYQPTCSKRAPSSSLSSIDNKQTPVSRRRRRRRRRRRTQRRLKPRIRSTSRTTQIATEAFELLHISSELYTKPLEFIERDELTRHHALQMPMRQRPIVFLDDYEGPPRFPRQVKDGCTPMDDDYHSSDA